MKKNCIKKEGSKKQIEKYLKGDGPVVAKTKYERILKEHLKNEKAKITQKEENSQEI